MIDPKAADTRQTLTDLIESKRLDSQNVANAIVMADISPTSGQWQGFINLLLLWFGSIALAFGTIFFVAANWQELGRMAKFALLEALIVSAMMTHVKFRHNRKIRQASLLVCILFVGALMALFGQTYQTGADPWQLFFNWAMLTTPWVLLSRFSVIWLIWLALLNLSISLYYQTFGGYLNTTWALFIFNAAAFVTWQASAYQFKWLDKPWAINLLAAICGSFALEVYINALFKYEPFGIIVWCLWAGLTFYVYRYRTLNLFILAGWSLAVLIAANALLIRLIPDLLEPSSFMILTMLTIGLGTYLTVWLKSLIKVTRL